VDLTRRQLLGAGSALLGARLLRVAPVRAQPSIHPRDAWGADLSPTGPLEVEDPGDVLFLIVHHTATGNDYAPDAVPGILRSIYNHHTAANGWPDVAYNFFVDRFGAVWEGRAGSLHAPVKGDATGGSQGFALLATFIGDHSSEPPTGPAVEAMTGLLAHLASAYGIDPVAETTFVSRGSNRWPAGTAVTTPTIAGHRDMSLTTCPGDAGYALVTGVLPGAVAGMLAPASRPTPTPEPPAEPESPTEPGPPAEPEPTLAPSPAAQAAPAPVTTRDERRVSGWTVAAAGSLLAGAAAAIAARLRAGGRGSAGSGPSPDR
jgi:hypothetical protein